MICVKIKQRFDPEIVFNISDISYLTLAKLSGYMRIERIQIKDDGLLIPPTIHLDGEAYYAFMKSADYARKTAKHLIDAYDIPKDEANYILPQCCPVSADIVVNPAVLKPETFLKEGGWEAYEIVKMMKEIAYGRES